MTKNLLSLLLIASFITGCFAWNMLEPQPTLAAALPQSVAVFETSLAAPITSSATTMTLTANSIRGGGALSGYNCFSLDEGSAQAETICGTISGTTVSSLTRGISQSTGTTTVTALQFSHRRGANVKITDFPVLQIVKAQNNGEDTFPNAIQYGSYLTLGSTTDLVYKKYVDDLAFSGAGVIDATAAARGVVELATAAEAAASTAQGSSGILVLPASLATSTYNSGTAGNIVPVTDSSTKRLAPNFLFPSTTASSTALSQNGSGTLSWEGFNYLLPGTLSTAKTTTSSTTMYSASIPANALAASSTLHWALKNAFLQAGAPGNVPGLSLIAIGYGAGTTTLPIKVLQATGSTYTGPVNIDFWLQNTGPSAQLATASVSYNMGVSSSTNPITSFATTTLAIDSTAAQNLLIVASSSDSTDYVQPFIGFMELLRR